MTTKRIGFIIIAILVFILVGKRIHSVNEPAHNNKSNTYTISAEIPPKKNFQQLTLVSSTTKRYLPNSNVPISTDSTRGDKIFDKWTGDVANVKDIFAHETTVKISTNGITLIATYKARPPEITTTQLPIATVGQPYSFQLEVENGEPPLSWKAGRHINKIDVWGYNKFGQCEIPPGLSNVVDIAAGAYHGLALTTNNTLVTWGKPTPGDESITNQTIDIVQMDGGCVFNVILKGDGTLEAWGTKGEARCDVPDYSDITQISIGGSFGLALRENGTVIAWGFNGMNQCNVPKDLQDVIQVTGGRFHALALKNNGTVVAWGSNDRGQCNVPADLTDVIQISAGDYHSIALKYDGTVVSWGTNAHGESSPPKSATDIIYIDAGSEHSLGLKVDGTVLAWGNNRYGECNIPTDLKNVFKIVAQGYKSIALSTPNSHDQLKLPRGLKLTSSGRIYGTPLEETSGKILFSTTDENGAIYEKEIQITVKPAPKHQVDIKNGSGSGQYPSSRNITITADPAPEGYRFEQWVGDIVHLQNAYMPITTLNTTTQKVSVTAIYKELPKITTEKLPDATVGQPYSFQLEVENGEPPLSWKAGKYINKINVWGANEYGQCNIPIGVSNVVDISAGGYNLLALMPDDSLITWGRKTPGDDTINNEIANIIHTDSGGVFSVALLADGSLKAWGTKSNGRCDVPDHSDIKQISIGVSFGLALRENGTVVAWGFNGMNQCNVPKNLQDVIQVAAGGFHSMALKSDGTIVAWGMNNSGQCNVPTDLTDVIQISAGDYHSIALKSNGSVVGWGANRYGEGTSPTSLNNVIQIDAGASHNLALKADRTVFAWGDKSHGECDVPDGLTNVIKIVAQARNSISISGNDIASYLQIPEGLSINSAGIISGTPNTSGTNEVLLTVTQANGITSEKTLQIIINPAKKYKVDIKNGNGSGQYPYGKKIKIKADEAPGGYRFEQWIGDVVHLQNAYMPITTLNTTTQNVSVTAIYKELPQITTKELPVATIHKEYSFKLQASGGTKPYSWTSDLSSSPVFAWGDNQLKQCDIPSNLNDIKQISVRNRHSLALKNDGTVVSWGGNQVGECLVPENLTDITQVSAGSSFSMALKANGTIVTWGSTANGRRDVPEGLNDAIQIAAGVSYGSALKENGTVVAWGWNVYGQCNIPPNLTNVTKIVTGGFHTLALKSDGTVTAWGSNNNGQCNVPNDLSNVVQLAASEYSSAALKADGTVVKWGRNRRADDTSEPLEDVVQIADGDFNIYAVKRDGTIVAWGENKYNINNPPATVKNLIMLDAGALHAVAVCKSNKPDGITVDSSGKISGTPTKTGTFPIFIELTDLHGEQINKSLNLIITN